MQTLVTDGADRDVSSFAQDLTEELVVHAARSSKPRGIEVRSESELRLMAEQVKDMADLRPEDCAKLEACLARMFEGEADRVLRGTLGRLGDEWVVTLKLIDVETMGVVRPGSCAGETREALLEALPAAVAAVLGHEDAAPPEPEIAIPSDGRKIGVMPIGASAADAAPGYFPYYADIYLFEEPLRYRPRLEPLPEPWYESPLFLTIAGVVVAGTAAAIAIAVMPGGSGFDNELE